jgi:predicted small metal-binding protein
MAKMLRCRDAGVDCDFVARGETEEDVMNKAVEHARQDHGMENVPDEVLAKARSVVHDEQ